MNLPLELRTARALSPPPKDHPELPLFSVPAECTEGTEGMPLSEPRSDASQPSVASMVKHQFDEAQPLAARMLNEFVYCPRLFYYEFVEGVFVENADTERGKAIHARVDKGTGEIPVAKKPKRKKKAAADFSTTEGTEEHRAGDDGIGDQTSNLQPPASSPDEETIHSRSVMLSSERLGVVAKLDLIEVRMGAEAGMLDLLTPQSVTPVDYKAGAPRAGQDGNELWDADKMQLGLQILILRDQGYVCDEGVIYYRATKQRVRLPMTPELEAWIVSQIEAARITARGCIPAPLVNSPKCVRCSLAPVCLPDETRMLAQQAELLPGPQLPATVPTGLRPPRCNGDPPRRLMAARDDARALDLNTPGLRVGCKGELLAVKDGDQVLDEVRVMDLTHVALFGNIQLSTQAVHLLCEQDIPVAWFSMGGWFYGLTRGHGMKNVFTRIEQFRAAENARRCLELARRFVHGKIRNQRTQLMRNHVELPEAVSLKLKRASLDTLAAESIESVLGIEDAAAAMYFQHFAGMVKVNDTDDDLPGFENAAHGKDDSAFTSDSTKRTRRPPTDPVNNALLSLAYSLLAKDCNIAACLRACASRRLSPRSCERGPAEAYRRGATHRPTLRAAYPRRSMRRAWRVQAPGEGALWRRHDVHPADARVGSVDQPRRDLACFLLARHELNYWRSARSGCCGWDCPRSCRQCESNYSCRFKHAEQAENCAFAHARKGQR